MKILSKLNNTGMIEEVVDKRYVTDAEKLKWNNKTDKTYVDNQDALKADKTYVDNKVKTDVPLNAKFTDTHLVESVNNKTGKVVLKGTDIEIGSSSLSFSSNVKIDYAIKSLGERIADNKDKKADKTYVDSQVALKADKIYVDNKVQTDVPSGAKFTDTVTTINGKIGAISKDDILALGINDGSVVDLGSFNNQEELITHVIMNQLPTGYYTFIMGIYPYFMLLREAEHHYRGTFQDSEGVSVIFQVTKTGVINYLFDVNIIESLTNLSDFKADTTYVDSQDELKADKTYVDNKVKTDVPSGAKFTDTVTTINGKTGAISKADIVALGIPSQDTNTTYSEITTAEIDAGIASTLRTITARRLKYLLDKIVALFPTKTSELTNDSGFLTSVTKSDVGLSNVDNIKQMPIKGGVLENYREKLTTVSGTSGTINLTLGNVFQHTPSGTRVYYFNNAVSGQAHSFTLIINQTATVSALYFPASVKWQGGEIPDLTTANKTYVLTFMSVNGGTTWLGMFGGEF